MTISNFMEMVENTVKKGKIASIHTVFSKDLSCRHVKTGLFGKGLIMSFL